MGAVGKESANCSAHPAPFRAWRCTAGFGTASPSRRLPHAARQGRGAACGLPWAGYGLPWAGYGLPWAGYGLR
jgi:hypothetical protein